MDSDELHSRYGVSLEKAAVMIYGYSPSREVITASAYALSSLVRDDRFWSGLPDDIATRTELVMTIMAYIVAGNASDDYFVDHTDMSACRDE
jgi:hypothetical protein